MIPQIVGNYNWSFYKGGCRRGFCAKWMTFLAKIHAYADDYQ